MPENKKYAFRVSDLDDETLTFAVADGEQYVYIKQVDNHDELIEKVRSFLSGKEPGDWGQNYVKKVCEFYKDSSDEETQTDLDGMFWDQDRAEVVATEEYVYPGRTTVTGFQILAGPSKLKAEDLKQQYTWDEWLKLIRE